MKITSLRPLPHHPVVECLKSVQPVVEHVKLDFTRIKSDTALRRRCTTWYCQDSTHYHVVAPSCHWMNVSYQAMIVQEVESVIKAKAEEMAYVARQSGVTTLDFVTPASVIVSWCDLQQTRPGDEDPCAMYKNVPTYVVCEELEFNGRHVKLLAKARFF